MNVIHASFKVTHNGVSLPAVLLLHDTLILIEAVVGTANERGCAGTWFVAKRCGAAVGRRHWDYVLAAGQTSELAFGSVNESNTLLQRIRHRVC